MTGVEAERSGVAPSYDVPAASPAVMLAVLTLTTLPWASKAKLFGAETVEPDAVQSVTSSSATKAVAHRAADVLRELLGEEAEIDRQAVGGGRYVEIDPEHRDVALGAASDTSSTVARASEEGLVVPGLCGVA